MTLTLRIHNHFVVILCIIVYEESSYICGASLNVMECWQRAVPEEKRCIFADRENSLVLLLNANRKLPAIFEVY